MKIKSGFSLAEMLVALAIVAIMTAIAATTYKPEAQATKYLYINAYNSLSSAYYNGILKGFTPFDDELVDEPSHTTTNDTGAEMLCRNLTTFINTRDNVKTASNDYSSTCSATKITNLDATEFAETNVQFYANNGMKFYITNRIQSAADENAEPFYVVFVDINGNKQPNRFDEDIFAFAMLSSARVVPLGRPEYDSEILTARFAYFDNDGTISYSKESLAYYQAKGAAWGYYSDREGNENLQYTDDEPFTCNDYIRSIISEVSPNSNIVANFPDLAGKQPVSTAVETYRCSSEDLESCYIFLDGYRPY